MADDVMGAQGYSVRRGGGENSEDDVEGHSARKPSASDDSDVEGHIQNVR